MTKDEMKLVRTLNNMEGKSGNISLIEKLGWGKHKYWKIRNELVSRGILETGKGRGGSIIITDGGKNYIENQLPIKENHLYIPIKKTLEDNWANVWGFGEYVVEVVAHGGNLNTGGRWTRPDLVLIGYTSYEYLPDKVFEVITFEVKTSESLDVTGVYEALAHRRAATRAYLLAPEPNGQQKDVKDSLESIEAAAAQYGVGFILAGDPENSETWIERVEAVRHDPSPKELNKFLSQQLPDTAKETVKRWFR